jgi:hypothetical protein
VRLYRYENVNMVLGVEALQTSRINSPDLAATSLLKTDLWYLEIHTR